MKYKTLNIKLAIPDDYNPEVPKHFGDCVSIVFTFRCV